MDFEIPLQFFRCHKFLNFRLLRTMNVPANCSIPSVYFFLSIMTQTGRFVVGNKRTAPASLYYEIHGNGPEKVCLVMGKS
jgi:hypothetical protein